MNTSILLFQFDNITDKHLNYIGRFDELLSEKFDACRVYANGGDVHDSVFREFTISEIGTLIDAFSAIHVQYEVLIEKIKDLQHFKDTSIGLNVTDKPIGDLLQLFWGHKSDACPLECSVAEQQELQFREWVDSVSWILS